jgi:hypothetical protein
MQKPQKQGTSTSSRSVMGREKFHPAYPEGGFGRSKEYAEEAAEVKPFLGGETAQEFETWDSAYFHAEFCEKGNDIVYHFWPPGDNSGFPEGFLTHVQEAFRKCLPAHFHGKVRADYTSLTEAQVHHMHGMGAVPKKDVNKAIVHPKETVYVRVPGGMDLPLADKYLKGKVFHAIDDEFRGGD